MKKKTSIYLPLHSTCHHHHYTNNINDKNNSTLLVGYLIYNNVHICMLQLTITNVI